MSSLLYREDADEAKDRLTTWWRGGDIGRPVMLVVAPRANPLPVPAAMPEPEGWVTHYSTKSFEYRVNLSERVHADRYFLGEMLPTLCPDLAPNCLALYLGCRGVEMPGTVWCEPCITTPESARFEFDSNNFYWDFTLRLTREQIRIARGKSLLEFPDLIEGLDTLAAMRGTEELLTDFYDRPEWVHDTLRLITQRYFEYYDALYDMMRDERGGSVFWAWSPGRTAKFQCDFSAMISPAMFKEFMVPVLIEMTRRVDHCMYHWDGPGALPHHDHLLALPDLDMIQWTPGAGVEPGDHPRWWPLYHKTVDAGKKIYVPECRNAESLKAMKREFGRKLHGFMFFVNAPTRKNAEEMIRIAAD